VLVCRGMACGRMRLWRLQVTGRRSRTQWSLLPVVAAVALVCTTLLAGLSLLISSTERFALTASLKAAPRSATELELSLSVPQNGLVKPVLDRADAAAAATFGKINTTSRSSITSHLVHITLGAPSSANNEALAYFGALAEFADHAHLTSGHWPTAPSTTSDSAIGTVRVIPVAVPTQVVDKQAWKIGDRIFLTPVNDYNSGAMIEVVGIYAVNSTTDAYWKPDLLGGAGFDPAFPVPGSGGRIILPAYGPFVVDGGAFASAAAGGLPQADVVRASFTPDLSAVLAGDIGPLLSRLDKAQDIAIQATQPATGNSVPIVSSVDAKTALPDLLQRVLASLTITRSSVLVAGLLLLVLGVAALLQTARLLAERRTGEQHLMRARGASTGQLIGLAGIEAVALAAVTTALSPELARRLFLLVAQHSALAEAGMDRDPGIPRMTWYVAGVVGLVFAVVLVSPLLRRATTFVEAEQARARPDRLSAIQRSGLDFAILVLAGLAYWQLRSYRAPVLGTGTSYRVDPILTVGPALALLAGALLCVRLVPAASRVTERLAARGHGFVAPLAAWEVGRRPARATSAILLLTLALAVGTFAQSFLTTWRTSQADQVDFLNPVGVRIADMTLDPFDQRAAIVAVDPAAKPSPVLDRVGGVGTLSDNFDGPSVDNEISAHVLGLSRGAAVQLTGTRVDAEGGAQIKDFIAAGAANATVGLPLPGAPTSIKAQAWVTGSSSSVSQAPDLKFAIMVQNTDGLVRVVDAGTIPMDGAKHDIEAVLVAAPDAKTPPVGVTGLRIVGFQATVVFNRREGFNFSGGSDALFAIGIADVRSVQPSATQADPATAITYEETAAPGDGGAQWYAASEGLTPRSAKPPEGAQLGLSQIGVDSRTFRFGQARVVAVPWPVSSVRALLTPALLQSVGGTVGEDLALRLGDAIVPITVVGTIDHIPGSDPYGQGVVVDLTELSQATARQVNTPALVDAWWLSPPASSVQKFTQAVTDKKLGTVTSHEAVLRERTSGALRVGTQGALWLVTLAAALLAAAGFAIHAAVTIRARETEFAQLRAVGLSRRSLTGVIAIETLLLSLLGCVFGIGLGVLLSWLIGPLVGFTVDGRAPFPAVLVAIPWQTVGLLAAEAVALLAVVVTVVARTMRSADPASVLRFGDER
jgi:FtsX-like permease family